MTRETAGDINMDEIYESETDDPELDYDREIEIDRGDTGMRIGFTLLFLLIVNVVEGLLMLLVAFQLVFALITQREPSPELKRFANRIIGYLVRVGRYITYNDPEAPFPFREFPEELDLTAPAIRDDD